LIKETIIKQRRMRNMKKIILMAVLLLAVSLIVGNVYAGSICIDEVGHCNDIKAIYKDNEAGIYELFGYEYGCGGNGRITSGTGRIVGNMLYMGFTGSYQLGGPTDPVLALRYYAINLDTSSGTGSYSYNDGTFWNGTTAVVNLISCPVADADVDVDGADTSAR
jgi:hypothetical protein